MLLCSIGPKGRRGPLSPQVTIPPVVLKWKGYAMTDPRTARRMALFSVAVLLVAMACTCSNPLASLGGSTSGGGIGDFVWLDANGNGIQDNEELGVPGVEVQLLDASGSQVDDTHTDGNGAYSFANPGKGSYELAFIPLDGMTFTLKEAGSDDALDSDANQATGKTDSFDFDGTEDLSRDAGLVEGPIVTTQAPPKATPTLNSTATQEAAVPSAHITYDHTVPGQYSEIVIDLAGLSSGGKVTGTVTGPSVQGSGQFTAFAEVDGTIEIRVKIYQFGTYEVDIPDLGISQTVIVVSATATPF
jgi:SdrD B-like domain